MNSLVFHIQANKADTNLLESIKAYFGNQKIEILVKPKKQLSDIIEKNKNSKVAYVFKGNEFDTIASKILNDEPTDFERYKRTNP